MGRSGKYSQGSFALKKVVVDSNGAEFCAFCCLGVLTDIWLEENKFQVRVSGWSISGDNAFGIVDPITSKVHTGYLPQSVIQWAGISMTNEMHNLISMNDRSHDFSGIASYIESNQEKL